MTDNRLDEIRARHRMAQFAYEGQSPPTAITDIDYLLSLLDACPAVAGDAREVIRE